MAFVNQELETIYQEIRLRQIEVGRLALVEFDESEYAALLDWARRIAREYVYWWWQPGKQNQAKLVFLAFAMAFVRRNQYADDNAFWPDFEESLGLETMQRRQSIVDQLLWPGYQDQGLKLSYDDRGRRIVGTLEDEMQRARSTPSRSQFVEFFKWYYRHHSGENISSWLIAVYKIETDIDLAVLGDVLPALRQDCQMLAQVLDFAIENELYLTPEHLSEYRCQIKDALGFEYDPTRLRLVRNEYTLINLIRELQNHVTPAQFERILSGRPGSVVIAPGGAKQSAHLALRHWKPLPYGIYHVDGEEYRIVPHSCLRLEMMNHWLHEQIVQVQDRVLGYKKAVPFQVNIGRRVVEAIPYDRIPYSRQYVWVGKAPTGQKFAIDGHLRSESAGAEWQVALQLASGGSDRPSLCISITRLMLYYPDCPHQMVRIWASTGYEYEDTLREDGVRRFHLHRRLVIPLDDFESPVEVGVDVGNEQVLCQSFELERYYLFSVANRERVQVRSIADLGDREYVLFASTALWPEAGAGVTLASLPDLYGSYTVYSVTWDDASYPFQLQVGSAQWTFERRREFAVMVEARFAPVHLGLKPHQCLQFQDLYLRLYSTIDLTAIALSMQVYGDEGLLGQIEIASCVHLVDAAYTYEIDVSVWHVLESLTSGQYGRYLVQFCDAQKVLGEVVLSLLPALELKGWNDQALHLETELLQVSIVSSGCLIWDPQTRQLGDHALLQLAPRMQAEPWPEHAALRRIVSQPVFASISFPDLGETVDIVVYPQVFGFRFYLKRIEQISPGKERIHYQPLGQADYYHLSETSLYVFSAPRCRVEMKIGAWIVWSGETDENGDLLIDSLADLCQACLDERTPVIVRCGTLQNSFVVRWAPLLQSLTVKEGQAIARFNGPEDASVRLRMLNLTGETYWSQDIPCEGKETASHIALPADRHTLGYLIAEYVLPDGEVRPSVWQVQVGEGMERWFPSDWLLEGIGLESLGDVSLALVQVDTEI